MGWNIFWRNVHEVKLIFIKIFWVHRDLSFLLIQCLDKINDGSQKRTQWGEIFSDGMSMWDKSRCVRKWGKFNLYQVDLSFLFIQCLDKINDSSQKSYNKVSWHFGYPMLQWNCQIGNMTHNTLEINVSFQMLLKIYTV